MPGIDRGEQHQFRDYADRALEWAPRGQNVTTLTFELPCSPCTPETVKEWGVKTLGATMAT
jgi:hypothetical protein